MKYLVDAMVLSEPAKPTPDPRVIAWLRALEPDIAVDPVILCEPETLFDAGAGRVHRLPWDADTGLKRAAIYLPYHGPVRYASNRHDRLFVTGTPCKRFS